MEEMERLQGTRDEKAVEIMKRRLNAFGLLLGGVPPINDDTGDREQRFAEAVLRCACEELSSLNGRLAMASATIAPITADAAAIRA